VRHGGRRFAISFEPWYAVLSTCLGLPPSSAYVLVDDQRVHLRMGWAFGATFPRAAVAATFESDQRPFSRGVHGFGRRWLVNGAGGPILGMRLDPGQRASLLGIPIRLRELYVSVDDPADVATALTTG
jgi:hypothetical protein